MTQFTVAQSLRRSNKLKGRYAELSQRAAASVSYEAGKKPAFDFKSTRTAMAEIREELIKLKAARDQANAVTTITVDDKRMSLAEAVRRLQELRGEITWVSNLVIRSGTERSAELDWDESLGRQVRRTREVTMSSELNEVDRATELEALRDRFERLNDAVEAANHRTLLATVEPEA
jgi:PAS domain-containing protein